MTAIVSCLISDRDDLTAAENAYLTALRTVECDLTITRAEAVAFKLAHAITAARSLRDFYAISRYERGAYGHHDGFTLASILEDGRAFLTADPARAWRFSPDGWHALQNAAWAYQEELPNL